MLRWEYGDLGELRPRNPLEKMGPDDTHKLVVLPEARHRWISDIITWTHCYARYTAAMAAKFPTCTGGLMAHMVTVLKAYTEAEAPI